MDYALRRIAVRIRRRRPMGPGERRWFLLLCFDLAAMGLNIYFSIDDEPDWTTPLNVFSALIGAVASRTAYRWWRYYRDKDM